MLFIEKRWVFDVMSQQVAHIWTTELWNINTSSEH